MIHDDAGLGEMGDGARWIGVLHHYDGGPVSGVRGYGEAKAGIMAPCQKLIRECPVPSFDGLHAHLIDDLLTPQSGMDGGEGRGPHLESSGIVVGLKITDVEIEGVPCAEPAGNPGVQLGDQPGTDLEVRESGAAAKPFQRPRRIEIHTGVSYRKRELSSSVISVDEAIGTGIMSDRC
jgi:hypothetical protein